MPAEAMPLIFLGGRLQRTSTGLPCDDHYLSSVYSPSLCVAAFELKNMLAKCTRKFGSFVCVQGDGNGTIPL